MKLSGLRPDMDKTNDASVTHAIETVKETNGITVTQPLDGAIQERRPMETTGGIMEEKTKERIMTMEEVCAYADVGVLAYITQRIATLNEGLQAVQQEGNTILESEALLMVLAELERVKFNIPGYKDHSVASVNAP